MKLKVNRDLKGGRYNVQFDASEFTEDERKKFLAFGIPVIQLTIRQAHSGAPVVVSVPLTEVSNYSTWFPSEDEARQYEARVLDEIKTRMKALRERTDAFSSSEEISL